MGPARGIHPRSRLRYPQLAAAGGPRPQIYLPERDSATKAGGNARITKLPWLEGNPHGKDITLRLTALDDIGDSLSAWQRAAIEAILNPRFRCPHPGRTAVAFLPFDLSDRMGICWRGLAGNWSSFPESPQHESGRPMVPSVVLDQDVEIPFVSSLSEFRQWALSEDFPERGRIDYLGGRIEVDMTPEDYYSHGGLKVEVVGVLRGIVKAADLGDLRSDRTRLSNTESKAELSVEPDVVFVSHETFESGRARLVAKAGGEADRYVELVGAPDLVVEIVSDRSVNKDTERLPSAYWKAGVTEYWLMDARGERLSFRIFRHGSEGFESAQRDADGFQYSTVFQQWFRLYRTRDRRGGVMFDLQRKDG